MINATMAKFGYPKTLVHDYRHWCVLVRPAQATLGALVLVCKDDAQAFSDIPAEAFSELATVTADIEASLQSFRTYQKINYLMLMMVDKEVHFHVLPRYQDTQVFDETEFADSGWPGMPNLSKAVSPDPDALERIKTALKDNWTDPV